jgi:uncharacterized membrane protein
MKIPAWLKHGLAQKILTIALLLVVLGAVGAIVYNAVNQSHGQMFTEFHLLGAAGKTESYVTTAKARVTLPVTVGIHNEEGITATYRVELKINGVQVQDIGPMVLTNNQAWEEPMNVTFTNPGDNKTAEFYLYIFDGKDPYLNPLRLAVDVAE